MDLGLFEDAAQKLATATERESSTSQPHILYALASANFALAKKHMGDGKYGVSFERIKTAVQACDSCSYDFVCLKKLQGDLYSFGAVLPSSLFLKEDNEDVSQLQLEFVRKGQTCYLEAEKLLVRLESDENQSLRAALIVDGGVNKLVVARLERLNQADERGAKGAAVEFQRALEMDPMCGAAWCGLGCAYTESEPLLAQHAFSRSLQLDRIYPDPYSNLAFLYTSLSKSIASSDVLNLLAQIADSPTTWINQAIRLEREANAYVGQEEEKLSPVILKTSDAYRASLQVSKYDTSLLGLAMSGCWLNHQTDTTLKSSPPYSSSYLQEYMVHANRSELENDLLSILPQPEKPGNSPKLLCDTKNESQVMLEPDNGHVWLHLAKSYATSPDTSDNAAAARVATHRAKKLLQANAFRRCCSDDSKPYQREIVEGLCDATAMLSLLDESSDVAINATGARELQKALLLSPANPLARAALGCT